MIINRDNLIKLLIILFLVQIVLAVSLKIFSIQSIKARTIGKSLIKELNVNEIKSLEFKDNLNNFLLEKKNGIWFLNDKGNDMPAELVQIDSFLDILRTLPEGVTKDKGEDEKNIALYGLDNNNYRKVLIKSQKRKDIAVYIGTTGVVRGSSYIRFNNEKKIREVRSIISNEAVCKAMYWAKKRILDEKLVVEDVKKMTIESTALNWFAGSYSIDYKEAFDEKGNIIKDNFVLNPPLNSKIRDYSLPSAVNYHLHMINNGYKFGVDVKTLQKLSSVKLFLKDNKTSYETVIYRAEKNDTAEYIVDVDFNDYLYLVTELELKKFINKPSFYIE